MIDRIGQVGYAGMELDWIGYRIDRIKDNRI